MTQYSLTFDMTDSLMVQAVREERLAIAREHLRLRELLVILVSTAIFVISVQRNAHWIWWLAALPGGFFALLALGWIGAYFWRPRSALARVAPLPHRSVRVEMTEERVASETATELLQVKWSEVSSLKRLSGFWLFCLASGARIPVPNFAVTEDMAQWLAGKFGTRSKGDQSAA